jgi:hypothetical protein
MSVFLDKATSKVVRRDWMDRTSGSRFRYRYEVVFQDGKIRGPRTKVSSVWTDKTGTVLVITPSELYEAVELEVALVDKFALERWPAVQVIVRYRTDDGRFEHYGDDVLKAGHPSFKTRFRIDRGVPGRREVQLTYMGALGERVETPWMPMVQSQWIVEDPWPATLDVRAVVAGDRQNVANLLVDLEYEDPDAHIHQAGHLSFDADNINQPQSWAVNLHDPSKRRYRYRMTLVTKDGDFLQTGWISTDAPTLPVGEVYVRQLSVEVVTGELARDIEAVEVTLKYDDSVNDVHDVHTLRLGPNSRGEWRVSLKDASQRSYQMTTTWIRSDGFNAKLGPVTQSETYVVVPGAPPR